MLFVEFVSSELQLFLLEIFQPINCYCSQINIRCGAVARFVSGFNLEFARFRDLVSGVEGLGGAFRRGEGEGDGAGGGFVVFPGGNGIVTDFEFVAGNGYGRTGDDVHGACGDRDGRGICVLWGRRVDRRHRCGRGRVNGLRAAGDGEGDGKERSEESPGQAGNDGTQAGNDVLEIPGQARNDGGKMESAHSVLCLLGLSGRGNMVRGVRMVTATERAVLVCQSPGGSHADLPRYPYQA